MGSEHSSSPLFKFAFMSDPLSMYSLLIPPLVNASEVCYIFSRTKSRSYKTRGNSRL